MRRREFVKAIPLTTLLPAALTAGKGEAEAASIDAAEAAASASSQAQAARDAESGALPDYAGKILYSDMSGTNADGNTQQGFAHTNRSAGSKEPYQMPLTQEEQDIIDGKKGPELAKIMKIVVAHGNAFAAERLVDLGGAPHCSLYTGTDYMGPMIKLFDECAKAGLKSYKPYTVNPRCYDLYNLNNNVADMQMIYEGYRLQRDLDWVHARLGAPDLNFRSCACYVEEVGNKPPPGTYVAWAESSAVNYGNSVLGLRTNRNAGGMELCCALVGKAPLFGLMTDEGRMATWLIEVKTTKEPDWGVVGSAVGLKVVDAVPFYTGLEKYMGGKVTPENMHLLKKMGSASAATGAVGLYHVEGVTPDANEKGRDLLAERYQTYVIDDAEQERIRSTFPTEFEDRPENPTHVFIGCPHNTYHELLTWGQKVTEAVEKRSLKTAPIPTVLFCPNPVRDRLVEEEPLLVGKMKAAGMKFTNMCGLSYAGMKGFSERVYAVTNSPKTRNYYPNVRYLPDEVLVEVASTGKVPEGA